MTSLFNNVVVDAVVDAVVVDDGGDVDRLSSDRLRYY